MINTAQADRRQELDQYFSPGWTVDALLHYQQIEDDALIGEPCAGSGAMVSRLRDHGYATIAGDIDESLANDDLGIVGGHDFLRRPDRYADCDWIITNPPYSCQYGTAADIFRAATRAVNNVAMLLRMGWLEACGDRFDLLPRLDRVLVIANPRVQFKGSGSSNPGQSVWCIWRREHEGCQTRLQWMDRRVCDDLRRREKRP